MYYGNELNKSKEFVHPPWPCYTAVFSVVTQRSCPLTLRDDNKNDKYVQDSSFSLGT